MSTSKFSPTKVIAEPLTLPCGLVLPNRLVKCPMQETLAEAPLYDPPMHLFKNLYGQWGKSKYGLIITGQVQIDIRYLSVAGDVVCHASSLDSPHFELWKEWASIAQAHGTPTIVQIAHPGRMSPTGAGNRPPGTPALCPSSVPIKLGETWLDKMAVQSLLGTPRAMTIDEIDQAVLDFKHGVRVAKAAGFAGVQLHAAHGFLISQFLSPHTNRRTDAYGGSPEARLLLLKRLVQEVRAEPPAPFCLSVKLNSADYMASGGLTQDEALSQVEWLVHSGLVDFVEISGGNAEQRTSGLHNSFGVKSISKAPMIRESTRIREAYFNEFAERVQGIQGKKCPIQLSGGFRSRNGMADAIASGACDLIGLGRTAVLEPDLPLRLLDAEISDEEAFAIPFIVKGQWFSDWMPIKAVGAGLPIQVFYYNMRRLGMGFRADPDKSVPGIVVDAILGAVNGLVSRVLERLGGLVGWRVRGERRLIEV